MDAQAFCLFLKKRLEEAALPVESNILNVVSQDIEKNVSHLSRLAGYRDMLREVAGKLDPLLTEFVQAKNDSSV